ncbi:MAG: LicD family protein [Muribaculaceae bacterium]|nr:LicD family protein [Muribaculaceae bacterium]
MSDKPTFNQEELRARFNPEGSPLRRQQMVMLEMAKVFDSICKKHNIPYFLYAGSLLGAFRHKGFIPWDDDFDVALLRNDYKRLMRILPDELPSSIVLQNNDTDHNYYYFYAKLRDRNSFLDEGLYDHPFKERGIFIDIFPLDRLWPWVQRLPLQSYAFTLLRGDTNCGDKTMRKIRMLTWFNRHISFPILRGFCRITGAKPLMCDLGIPFHRVYNLRDVFPLSTLSFEGTEFSVPSNCSSMLKDMYGDFMKLPEDLENVYHHADILEFYK